MVNFLSVNIKQQQQQQSQYKLKTAKNNQRHLVVVFFFLLLLNLYIYFFTLDRMGRTHGWVTSVSLLCNDNDDDDGVGISSVRPEFLVNKTTKYPQWEWEWGSFVQHFTKL